MSTDSTNSQFFNIEGIARLPQFSHAAVAGDTIYVSGTLGTVAGSSDLVEGGVGPQTAQILRNFESILAATGSSLANVVKVSVYLTDMSGFREMNDAYCEVFGEPRPARITVGVAELALGARVEMECIATRQHG
ncbi:MAG: RidA family protein [Acidimicrobiales bacterium]